MYRQTILQILPHFWNNRVCFSHVRLKENFQKTLEVIKKGNRAHKFCGILIKANELTQETDCFHPPPVEVTLNKDELEAHSIICELKEIIHEDKPEYILIDTILEAFINSSNETRQQLISLLFSIDTVNFFNPKSQSSKEYLKYFISEVGCFFRNANKIDPDRILDTQGALRMVETMLLNYTDYAIHFKYYLPSIVSNVIFDERHHSDDHNREIEALMSDAVSLISTRLSLLNSASKSIIEKCLLARRSSLAIDKADSDYEQFYLGNIEFCYRILDEVPFYYMSRKERLLQHLKDTKSSNNAWEFCELLNSINKLNSDKKSLNSNLIMNRLKEIIHTEKPEYSMNKFILRSLENRTHHLKEVSKLISRFLLDIDNFDCEKQNSEEYLMHFIQEFQRLFNIYARPGMKFYGFMESISIALKHIALNCTKDLLRALANKYQLHFFDEEKKKIGFLMVEAITPIEKFVYYRSGGETYMKIKSFLLFQRSSLQYFRDFFDSFPVDETPLKHFDMNRIDLCIKKLDRNIDIMCESAESWAEESEEEDEDNFSPCDYAEHDDIKEDGESMPESHVWWAKCSQTLNNLRINAFLNQLCYNS
ncbi:uncharacterized protein [Parasteatoda tepidariorum]|uniref:uncharacterized protein n=1 Tax=Parasteatoda tepidariorum TaxID=114398 RepID=UPI00077FD0BA|nr:uncharacterized protein LOC107438901 [Parasteatoda tepidariorum]